jgi:hypothetical protein
VLGVLPFLIIGTILSPVEDIDLIERGDPPAFGAEMVLLVEGPWGFVWEK